MADKFNHIDKFLQKKMDGFQVESSQEDFAKFQKKLSGFRFFHFHWNVFNLYYLLFLILLVLGFSLYKLNQDEDLEKVQSAQIQKIKNTEKAQRPENIKNGNQEKVSKINDKLRKNPVSTKKSILKENERNQQKTSQSFSRQEKSVPQDNQSDENHSEKQLPTTKEKIIIIDTIQVPKRIIVYDTVKTIIVKQVKPEKKRRRNRQ